MESSSGSTGARNWTKSWAFGAAEEEIQGDDGLESQSSRGREPFGPQGRSGKAECRVGSRHHRHTDRRGLVLSGRGQGYLLLLDRRLRLVREDDAGTRRQSPGAGHKSLSAFARPDPSLGSRQPVLLGGLSATSESIRQHAVNEPERQLLRQRPHGKLLGHAKDGVGASRFRTAKRMAKPKEFFLSWRDVSKNAMPIISIRPSDTEPRWMSNWN